MGNFFFFPGRCDDYILCGAHNTTGFKEKNSNTKTAVALSLLPHDVRCIQHKRVGPYTIRVSTPPPSQDRHTCMRRAGECCRGMGRGKKRRHPTRKDLAIYQRPCTVNNNWTQPVSVGRWTW